MLRPVIRPRARADLVAHAQYIAGHSEIQAARLLDNFKQSVAQLCEHPRMAAVADLPMVGPAEIRAWPVSGFRHHVILFAIEGDDLVVVRVRHAAEDPEKPL